MLTVVVGLLSAYCLNEMALQPNLLLWQFIGGIAMVLGLNGIRFVVWGYIHKRYPLSYSYPLTAVFFPMIVVLAIWQGNHIYAVQYLGLLVITVGIYLLTYAEDHG